MFGGNSNWRGPVWMPVNYLAIRQFVRLPALLRRRLHRSSTRPARAGSARFGEIAQDLADRLVSIWLPGRRRPPARLRRRPSGSRTDPAWKDNLLFFEYFHGDNGAGLGAMHQTGWTALVADLILDPPGASTPGKRDQSTAT